MLLDILKVLVGVLSGGVAGAFLNEWFRRRGAKVQTIPLIQRVNRLVKPGLKEFSLARKLSDGSLEEVTNVREYQFTLRNTSAVHLQDVEVQFEFPADDVEGHAERPTLSKTPPVPTAATVTPPWKRGFRWKIPQHPSTDSIDFTFRAVEPESEDFEVALFGSGRVVVERSERDSPARSAGRSSFVEGWLRWALVIGWMSFTIALVFAPFGGSKKTLTTIDEGGCALTVISSYSHFNSSLWPWQGPWQTEYQIMNRGNRDCSLRSGLFPEGIITVGRLEEFQTVYSADKPRKVWTSFFVGINTPTHEAKIEVYAAKKAQ